MTAQTPAPVKSMRSVTILEAARHSLASRARMGAEGIKVATALADLEKILATLPDETAGEIRSLVGVVSTASFNEGRALARATEYRLIVEEFGVTVEQVVEMHAPRDEQTEHAPDAV